MLICAYRTFYYSIFLTLQDWYIKAMAIIIMQYIRTSQPIDQIYSLSIFPVKTMVCLYLHVKSVPCWSFTVIKSIYVDLTGKTCCNIARLTRTTSTPYAIIKDDTSSAWKYCRNNSFMATTWFLHVNRTRPSSKSGKFLAYNPLDMQQVIQHSMFHCQFICTSFKTCLALYSAG